MSTIQPVILTADHDVLLGFYTKLFGAEEIFRVPEEGPVFYLGLRIGDTDLGLVAKANPGDREASRILLSIGVDDVEAERERLRPLPADDYDCGIDLTPTVARNSRITVRQCYYSVPAKFIGTKVRVKLRANELWVFDGRKVVARHPRLTRRYTYHDILDHYLEILLVKRDAPSC